MRSIKHPKQVSWLRDVILGGQDGLVNVFGVILGVTAASGDQRILIAASLAAAFAEAISLGAVAYTSAMAQRDYYQKELELQRQEIESKPGEEQAKVRVIYEAKGFSGDILERVVATITSNKQIWTLVLLEEEHGLSPLDTERIVVSACVVGLAAFIGSLIPLGPFVFLARESAVPMAVLVCSLALFILGVSESKLYVGKWWKNGLRIMIIGMGAAAAGYLVGKIFSV